MQRMGRSPKARDSGFFGFGGRRNVQSPYKGTDAAGSSCGTMRILMSLACCGLVIAGFFLARSGSQASNLRGVVYEEELEMHKQARMRAEEESALLKSRLAALEANAAEAKSSVAAGLTAEPDNAKPVAAAPAVADGAAGPAGPAVAQVAAQNSAATSDLASPVSAEPDIWLRGDRGVDTENARGVEFVTAWKDLRGRMRFTPTFPHALVATAPRLEHKPPFPSAPAIPVVHIGCGSFLRSADPAAATATAGPVTVFIVVGFEHLGPGARSLGVPGATNSLVPQRFFGAFPDGHMRLDHATIAYVSKSTTVRGNEYGSSSSLPDLTTTRLHVVKFRLTPGAGGGGTVVELGIDGGPLAPAIAPSGAGPTGTAPPLPDGLIKAAQAGLGLGGSTSTLGAAGMAACDFNGWIGEVMVFSNALSEADATAVTLDIGRRWQLPFTTVQKAPPPKAVAAVAPKPAAVPAAKAAAPAPVVPVAKAAAPVVPAAKAAAPAVPVAKKKPAPQLPAAKPAAAAQAPAKTEAKAEEKKKPEERLKAIEDRLAKMKAADEKLRADQEAKAKADVSAADAATFIDPLLLPLQGWPIPEQATDEERDLYETEIETFFDKVQQMTMGGEPLRKYLRKEKKKLHMMRAKLFKKYITYPKGVRPAYRGKRRR